jgi:hypothetical protein
MAAFTADSDEDGQCCYEAVSAIFRFHRIVAALGVQRLSV